MLPAHQSHLDGQSEWPGEYGSVQFVPPGNIQKISRVVTAENRNDPVQIYCFEDGMGIKAVKAHKEGHTEDDDPDQIVRGGGVFTLVLCPDRESVLSGGGERWPPYFIKFFTQPAQVPMVAVLWSYMYLFFVQNACIYVFLISCTGMMYHCGPHTITLLQGTAGSSSGRSRPRQTSTWCVPICYRCWTPQ